MQKSDKPDVSKIGEVEKAEQVKESDTWWEGIKNFTVEKIYKT